MATKPTRQAITDLANTRMHQAGITEPAPGIWNYEQFKAKYDKQRDTYLHDAELFLLHSYDLEQEREGQAAAIEAKKLEALTADLRHGYLSVPGATEAGFQAALPGLLEERARQIAMHGDPKLEALKQKQRQALRSMF